MEELIRIALCDDEKHVHETVLEILKEYRRKRNCTAILSSFFSAEELLETGEKFHILLLDIDMPQMDGIEAAYRLREQGEQCKIIMLTSKRERFKDAFKIGAYRFVTKPIDAEELEEALDDARGTLLGYAQVEVKIGKMKSKLFQYQIDYLQACGDYVKIHAGGTVCDSTRSLKSWKGELDSRLFVECHKSYLVNLGSISRAEKDMLMLENGEIIPVARRRRKDVLQAFLEFDVQHGRG
ncbi:MAG: LytTR family DNA-binding domain-containing protein [Lachnospiraceae bacterium]|nr:LytTR family DNA-binding domain-containing protein [Lachnospiraceae bacterium]